MGNLSDDFYQSLAAKSTPMPAPPPAPVAPIQPSTPVPSDQGPLVAAEEKIKNAIDSGPQDVIAADAGKFVAPGQAATGAPSSEMTPEEQIAKYGDIVGSQKYYENKAKQTFVDPGLSLLQGLGATMPDMITWDKMTDSARASYAGKATAITAAKMIVGLPRQLVTAPVRLAYSLYKPWADLVQGKTPTFQSAQNDQINVPYLGKVNTYWKDYSDARAGGVGPVAATLATATNALGDVTIGADLAEALNKAFQPRTKVSGAPLKLDSTKDVRAVVGEAQKKSIQIKTPKANSTAEYYSLPETVAKQYGGGSKDTYLKVMPADAVGDQKAVQISIVQTRNGVTQKIGDYVRGKFGDNKVTQGDFGPEIQHTSQTVPLRGTPAEVPDFMTGNPGKSIEAMIGPDGEEIAPPKLQPVLDKPLKGFEKAPVTHEQLDHLQQITAFNKIDSSVSDAIIKNVSGQDIAGNMTQADYVKASQILSAFNDFNKFRGAPEIQITPLMGRYLSPQRYWMRDYEVHSGLPVYSEAYVPMEDAFRLRNVFQDNYRGQAREIFGDYAGPKFAEERRLVKNYMEGNTAAIDGNTALADNVKTDLRNIAIKMRPLYDKLGNIFNIPTDVFLKDYQPHVVNFGGIYQLYKDEMEVPKMLNFFAENKRLGGMTTQIDDALALFDIYTNAGSNKLFLNPALERAGNLVDKLPGPVKNSVNSYIGEKLGYAGPVDRFVNEVATKVGKSLGVDVPADFGRQAIKLMMDTTYSASLGANPAAVARNLLQYHLLAYPALGPEFMSEAIKKVLSPGGLAELRAKGFIEGPRSVYGADLAQGTDAAGQAVNVYKGVTNATLSPFQLSDSFTRGATYWQGKFQWENALNLYNKGKINWSQFENKVNLKGMSPVDANIIRQRLVAGNVDSAFDHYIRDVIDTTQFPYRKGAGAQIGYGLGGKMAAQFSTWSIEYAHTIGGWIKTGQWDKLIRLYGSVALTQRTLKDSFGIDGKKWASFLPVAPALAPFMKIGSDAYSALRAAQQGNDEAMYKGVNDIVKEISTLGVPAGVAINHLREFYRSVKLTNQGNNIPGTKPAREGAIPQGQYGVFDSRGRLQYSLPAHDLLLKLFGMPSSREGDIKNLQNDMFNASFGEKQDKARAMDMLMQGKPEATQFIADHQISISASDFDTYHIPLTLRYFKLLPKQEQAKFGPRVMEVLQGQPMNGGE